MDLIRTQKDDPLAVVVKNTVFANHQMRRRDIERCLGKRQIVLNRFVVLINPTGQELFVHIPMIVSGNVACLLAIADDEHLNQAHQTAELPFLAIFRNLPEGIHERMISILEFNVNEGKAVDEQSYVKPAISLRSISFHRWVLINDFIARTAAGDLTTIDSHKAHFAQRSILTQKRNLSDLVFTG
ncbi:unknown [Sutterella sp. CAG:397]|nr:unknown [Sutterella sp. CAG:397]